MKKKRFKLKPDKPVEQVEQVETKPVVKDRLEAIKYYDNKLAQLKDIRQTYEGTWEQIINYIAPDLKGYLNVDRKDDGQRNDDMIYDGYPAECARKCAAGMWASISSPSRPWMRNKMRNKAFEEVSEANQWLDMVTELEYDIMQDSNFYQAMFAVYYQLSTIHTACMIVDPDYDSVANFTTLNVGEYWLGINGKGKVDTLFRELKYRGSQLIDKFGKDAVPESIQRTVKPDNPMGNEYTVVHVIEPDSQGIAPFRKPFVSAYYLKDEHKGQFLQIRGYKRKPFVSPRWFALSGETYGKMGPARNVLGDVLQLNTMVFDFHEGLQKVNNPPLQGDSLLLENNQISAVPGAFNPTNQADGNKKLEPLFAINPDLATTWQAIQDKKEQIAQGFFIDLFMAVSMRQDKDMTAEEVRSIAGERMLALGPGLDNLHTELLNEVIDIIFDYAADAGILPEPPEEIQGQEIKVDYVSVLAQAQKMVDMSRIDQVLQYVMNIASIYPDILDKVDLDQVIDEVAKMTGAPSSLIKSDEIVAQLRQAKAQQQQMMQLGQAGLTAADIAGKAGNIPMDGSNLASMVLGVNQ